MSGLHTEALLAAAYGLFLIAVAAGLERLARHSHVRSERYRTAGFTYHEHLDAWQCPEGEHLRLAEHDRERRLLRYRARARVCNGCPRKADCTESDEGREIARAIDPWPHSEAGRFHRGICLVIIALAALILAVEAARHHGPRDLVVIGLVSLAVLGAGRRLLSAFRDSPAGFPEINAR